MHRSTGASWLCYFRALQIGDVNKVVPIDKSGTILTIILAFIFFKEEISPLKFVCVVFIAIGTYMMITKKENSGEKRDKLQRSHSYLFYAVLSAVFAKLTFGLNVTLFTALMSLGGYVPNQKQTATEKLCINAGFIGIPMICLVLMVVLLKFFKVEELLKEHRNNAKSE